MGKYLICLQGLGIIRRVGASAHNIKQDLGRKCSVWKVNTLIYCLNLNPNLNLVSARGGILAENKFRILDDLFWIHFGRASILAKFWIICINFG